MTKTETKQPVFCGKNGKLTAKAETAVKAWMGDNSNVHEALQTIAKRNEALCAAKVIGKAALVKALSLTGNWPVADGKPVSFDKAKDGKLVDDALISGVNRFASWCSTNGKSNGKNKGSGRKAADKTEGSGEKAVAVSKGSVTSFLKKNPDVLLSSFEEIADIISEALMEESVHPVTDKLLEACVIVSEIRADKDYISTFVK